MLNRKALVMMNDQKKFPTLTPPKIKGCRYLGRMVIHESDIYDGYLDNGNQPRVNEDAGARQNAFHLSFQKIHTLGMYHLSIYIFLMLDNCLF